MVYTPLTAKAMQISYQAHHGQTDKVGVPYIFHPIHLAEQMNDEISCCVALLHDVVEDTHITLEDLSKEFPPQVVEAVALLTHPEGMDYFDYVHQTATNPVAKKVKLADLAHNSDQSRCIGAELPSEKLIYWQDKYARAWAILTSE